MKFVGNGMLLVIVPVLESALVGEDGSWEPSTDHYVLHVLGQNVGPSAGGHGGVINQQRMCDGPRERRARVMGAMRQMEQGPWGWYFTKECTRVLQVLDESEKLGEGGHIGCVIHAMHGGGG